MNDQHIQHQPSMDSIKDNDPNSATARAKLACESCRANKVRCIRHHGSESTCVRCRERPFLDPTTDEIERFGIICSDPAVQKRRGRPPKSSLDRRESGFSASPPPRLSQRSSFENNGQNHYVNPYPPIDHSQSSQTHSQGQGQDHSQGSGHGGANNNGNGSSSFSQFSESGPSNRLPPLPPPTQSHSAAQWSSNPFIAPFLNSAPQSAKEDPGFYPTTTSLPPPNTQHHHNNHNHNQHHHQSHNQNQNHSNHPILPPPPLLPRLQTGPSGPVNLLGPSPDSNIASSTPRSTTRDNLDLSTYLEPPSDKIVPSMPFFSNGPGKAGSGAALDEDPVAAGHTSEGEDPVSLSLLSAVEAHALVQLFHERLNPHVAVLDQQLHTMSFLRTSSTVLFSSVLAVASRFFRKDLHRRLASHAQTILDRALGAGASDIGVVQSLMILTYWKNPNDTSAWRKIGMAIRIGYQSFWHVPRREKLPDDNLAARHILNAERTWYCLFCFDRGFAQTFGLPVTIRLTEIGDCHTWAREHLYLGPSVDMHLAVSIELCMLKDHWRGVFESGRTSAAYVESAIDSMQMQCQALLARYYTRGAPPPGFDPDKEHVIVWCILDLILILKRHLLDLNPKDPSRIDSCLAIASQTVDEIELLAETGPLPIMQDTGSCMTSSLVVFLRRIFRDCSRTQKSLIVSLLQRILLSHTRVSSDDDDVATAYVARFTRRILGVVSHESRAASPPPPQPTMPIGGMIDNSHGVGGVDGNHVNTIGQVNGNGQNLHSDSDFLVELEQFLQIPDHVLENEVRDQEYWAFLFAADPTNNFVPTANTAPGFDFSLDGFQA